MAELAQRVRELDLAAGPAWRPFELVEDRRRQDVAADDREVARCLGDAWASRPGPGSDRADRCRPPARRRSPRRPRSPPSAPSARRSPGRRICSKTSTICFMQGTVLSMMSSPSMTANGSSFTRSLAISTAWPSPSCSPCLTYETLIMLEIAWTCSSSSWRPRAARWRSSSYETSKVVLDRVLALAGHDDDRGQARGDGLLDHVLDDRLVDERQHLLGLRLRRGQEARPQAGRGEHRLSDLPPRDHAQC